MSDSALETMDEPDPDPAEGLADEPDHDPAEGLDGVFDRVPEDESAVESQPEDEGEPVAESQSTASSLLQFPEDIALRPVDEDGAYFTFDYGDEEFLAYYEPDCWKVFDSYKITNQHDMVVICQALLDEHEVHGRDFESMRTAEDMAFEWQQHNIAYVYAPDGSTWQESARSVDLDPYDQHKTFREIFDDRT